jgi:hypothetical protein
VGVPRSRVVGLHRGKQAARDRGLPRVWTLGGLLDADRFAQLRRHAASDMAAFVASDGSVEFDLPMHVVTADKT